MIEKYKENFICKMTGWLFLLCTLAACNTRSYELNICDYGAVSGERSVNTALAVRDALAAAAKMDSAKLFFPAGTYHFYVDSLQGVSKAFDVQSMKNLVIDGNGAEFIFHGPLVIGTIDSCSNVTVRNFSIDWERPYITQGQIMELGDGYVDLAIDAAAYPYEISSQDSVFRGIGEGWKLGIQAYNLYDKERQEIVYRTRDMPMGRDLFSGKAREISPGVVRFFGSRTLEPELGTYIALWHGRYMTDGFYMFGSKDVTFRDIDIYHCPSHGLVGVRCENVTICNMNMKVNEKKGRVFSLIADAFHFNACRGLIKVDSCEHTGHGDDFINVHGMYVEIADIVDEYTFHTGCSERQNMTIGAGDELWFLKHDSLKRGVVNRIKAIRKETDDKGCTSRLVTLEKPMPVSIAAGDFVENKSYLADFEIRNCRILKKHRARGILVTTPGKVTIENNYFRTAGAAILIEGDVDYWYESGSCKDVRIQNNVFEDCFTSGHEWGEAVITVTPSYRPNSDHTLCYHENIRIEGNTFRHYDYALLYARAVRGLTFAGNVVERSYNYAPFYRETMFYLDGCKQADISGNRYGKDVLGMNIVTEHMKPEDIVRVDKDLKITNN
ncbi:right-handed parallel beta-helix repeat-containing protein [Bacteroides acidifaciens]|uniref:right-handed parallel beta-helix repeat-containing protein n=1 Tax=Bacteroides acidifaciens TaxID=85831 RepID=UPI00242B696B|nr:right-handed parallel beta-helix repeat-containing protein [Bacteroides acidifaciens]